MPSSPCEPNKLKFGVGGFYHQPNNLCDDGLNLKKKIFFEQPYRRGISVLVLDFLWSMINWLC